MMKTVLLIGAAAMIGAVSTAVALKNETVSGWIAKSGTATKYRGEIAIASTAMLTTVTYALLSSFVR